MPQTVKPSFLFDLGDTLMIHADPWTNVLVRASLKMEESAIAADFVDPGLDLARKFLARLKEYYAVREQDEREGSTFKVLQKLLLEDLGTEIPEPAIRDLIRVFYEQTRTNWHADPEAVGVLLELRSRGHRLAILSNAADREDVGILAKNFGFTEFLDFILTSVEVGVRKPNPAIFQSALQRLGEVPENVVMVGDRLDADICGAVSVGMSAVWIRRDTSDHPHPSDNKIHIVRSLREILELF